ncbi:hypothetical protein [Rhodococcus koreensis]|uniref:hypothetical protein n=1 Tax=Rhodococcus koreensis TaxID=99653 RepID=UPI001F124E4F|nr:hypothetical protein [Rhodococcus koreensis]
MLMVMHTITADEAFSGLVKISRSGPAPNCTASPPDSLHEETGATSPGGRKVIAYGRMP